MTGGCAFKKKRKRKNKLCSAISNAAWCDINSEGDIHKLFGMCPNPRW